MSRNAGSQETSRSPTWSNTFCLSRDEMDMSTKSTLVYSLGINVTVITLKAAVGTWTGSAAMLAEASHSLVDSLTGPLLLVGARLLFS